ncbi:SAM-dependent methyltransferase, partial [Acinetobacter baumannii]
IQGDFREDEPVRQLEALLDGRKADLVLSDMAPNLSGVAIADAARVEYLIDLAIEFAQLHMKPGGSLLVKCFNGTGYNELVHKFRAEFKT